MGADVDSDAEIAADLLVLVVDGGDGQVDLALLAVLAHVGPDVRGGGLGAVLYDEYFKVADWPAQLLAECCGACLDFAGQMKH